MKRQRIELQAVADMNNLYRAAWQTGRGRRKKQAHDRDRVNIDKLLTSLHNDIIDLTVPYNRFSSFLIHDPKRRIIHAPCLLERILHHALMNYIGPVLDRCLIDHTYACRTGKGSLAAVHRAKQQCLRGRWFVKVDVAQYFDSIDHEILLNGLRKKIKGREVLFIIEKIVKGFSDNGKGLPIGALTSQHFAKFYLSAADRFILESIKPLSYVRYMDDLVWWVSDKATAKNSLIRLAGFLSGHLALKLKENFEINRIENGLGFCGYRIYPERLKLNRRRKKRYVSRLNIWETRFENGEISSEKLQMAHAAVHGIVSHADCRAWRMCVQQNRRYINA